MSRARPLAPVLLAVLVGLTGCAGPVKGLRDATPPGATGASETLGEAYYHFLRALDAEAVGDLDAAQASFQQSLLFDPTSYQVMTRLSRVLERKGQREQALMWAERALQLAPDHVPALVQLARTESYAGRYEDAKRHYQRARELSPDEEAIYLELARLHRRDGALTEALGVLQAYQLFTPRTSVQHLSLMATVLREMNRPEEAERVYLELLSLYPWAEQPRRELIGLLLLNGGPEHAANRLEQLYEAEPWQDWIPPALVDLYTQLENIPALTAQLEELEGRSEENRGLRMEAAEALARTNGWAEAEALLLPALGWKGEEGEAARYLYAQIAFNQEAYAEAAQRFAAVDPSSELYTDALIRRAFSLQQVDRLDEGVAEITTFLAAHPDADEVRFALGAIYAEADRHAEAVATFDALLVRQPDEIDALAQRAASLYQLGETGRAIGDLEAAVARLPSQRALYRMLASLYLDERRYEDASATLRRALSLYPDDFDLRFQLASVLDLGGHKQEAVAQMKLLLERYPDNPDILNFIGYTYAELGIHLAEAEMMVRKALEQDPENGYITDSLGWIFFKQADYPRAAETLERAVALTDAEPVITEHLGDAYLKLNRLPEALATYRHAHTTLTSSEGADPAELSRIQEKIDALVQQGVSAQDPAVLAPKP